MLDENTSSPVIIDPCNRLRGWSIQAHTSYLERGVPDDEVVAFCGSRGWGLITLDEMRYTPETRIALFAHQVPVFKILTRKDSVFTEVAATIITAREKIIDLMHSEKTGLIAHVRINGDVVVMDRINDIYLPQSQLRSIRKYPKMGVQIAKTLVRVASGE